MNISRIVLVLSHASSVMVQAPCAWSSSSTRCRRATLASSGLAAAATPTARTPDAKLLARHRPVVVLHPDEQLLPVAVDGDPDAVFVPSGPPEVGDDPPEEGP